MRTHSVAEAQLLRAMRLVQHVRAEITDPGGAWVDWSNAYGSNWLKEIRWGANQDQPVMSGTVTLLREQSSSGISIAPSMTASPANSGGPAILEGRLIRLSTAVTVPGATPTGVEWREMFLGVVDEVEYGRKTPTLQVNFRDIGSRLLDLGMQAERTYGSTAGVPAYTVMQQMIDADWPTSVYGASPGLRYDPVVSPFGVRPAFKQQQKHVLEGVNDLAMQFGQVVRYRYDATDTLGLDLFLPDRGKVDPDATFGPGEYIELPRFKRSRDDVRNQVRVFYVNAIGQEVSYYDEDPVSIALYGPRYMQLAGEATKNIRTATEAQALCAAALWDLAVPLTEHVVESLLYWPVELGDLHQYDGNARQYDQPQKLAVVAYEHVYSAPGKARTTITTRGRVTGMGRQWIRKSLPGLGPEPAFPTITARVVPTTVAGDKVDIFVTPSTTGGEQLGVKIAKAQGGMSDPWVLCVSGTDFSPRFVDSGTEIGPTDWFWHPSLIFGGFRQLLNDVDLSPTQSLTWYAQAYGMMTQAPSQWLSIPLDKRPRPELESVAISASNPRKLGSSWLIVITLTFTGGDNIQSVSDIRVVDVAADPADAIVDSVNILPGQTITRSYPILASAAQVLDKVWGATLIPNNQPLANAVNGLPGFPVMVTTQGDAYQNANQTDLDATNTQVTTNTTDITALTLQVAGLKERTIQVPFGNGATMGVVNDWLAASPGYDFTVLRWKLRALNGAKAQVVTDAAILVEKLLETDGSRVTMATVALAGGTQSENGGSASGWASSAGLANDELIFTLQSLTNPNSATSLLLTVTIQPA